MGIYERRKNRSKSEDEDDLEINRLGDSDGNGKSKRKARKGLQFLSTKAALILVLGVCIGYVAIPMALVELGAADYRHGSRYDHPRTLVRNTETAQRLIEDRKVLSTQSLPTATSPEIMETQILSDHRRKKILVTGGAGFVGSHLVDKLMMEGHEVTVVDNFFTGQKKNIAHWLQHPNFR